MSTSQLRKPERGVVAGVFGDEASANRAVSELIEAHFDPPRDLNVIAAHHREHEDIQVAGGFRIADTAKWGALAGLVLGVVLAWLGAFGLIGGPVVYLSSNPILALLQGAYLGAVAGFATGAVFGLSFWKEKPDFDGAHVHGVTWVGVRAQGSRAEEARAILRRTGARHLMS
jgi:hypothetical protein